MRNLHIPSLMMNRIFVWPTSNEVLIYDTNDYFPILIIYLKSVESENKQTNARFKNPNVIILPKWPKYTYIKLCNLPKSYQNARFLKPPRVYKKRKIFVCLKNFMYTFYGMTTATWQNKQTNKYKFHFLPS